MGWAEADPGKIADATAEDYNFHDPAASLGQLGHVDEARAEIAELINHQPDASLALFRQHGFRHKWMHELHLEGLRKAGLREE